MAMASAFDAWLVPLLRWAAAGSDAASAAAARLLDKAAAVARAGAAATTSTSLLSSSSSAGGESASTMLLLPLAGTTALALLLALLLPALVRCWRTRTALGSTPLPAGAPLLPGGLPLLGHGPQVLRNLHRIHDWLYEAAEASSFRTFVFTVPFMPAYFVVTDAACLEHVLKARLANYAKGRAFRVNFGAILGDGIFTSDGEHWYWQRKLATHIFSVRSFKRYVDLVFSEKIEALARLLDGAALQQQQHLQQQQQQQQGAAALAAATTTSSTTTATTSSGAAPPSPAASSPPPAAAAGAPAPPFFDLQDAMYRFTLDSFGRIGFGVDLGCLRSADERVPFAVAFDEAQVIVNARFWLPAWPAYELLTGRTWRLLRGGAVVRRFARGIVRQRRAQLEAAAAAAEREQQQQQQQQQQAKALSAAAAEAKTGKAAAAADDGGDGASDASSSVRDQQQQQHDAGGGGDDKERDLLALLMGATRGDGRPLTGRDLMWSTLNYLIAGRDTTAQALTWCFYEVMRRPDVEARLVAEANEVLSGGGSGGNGGFGAHPSYDQLRALKFTRAVFLEALRLHPSVPEDVKFAVGADALPDGTRVPAGAQVVYSPYVVNRLPGFWGADALAFNPDRWLAMPTAPSPYAFLSFNAGPRLCVGQRLAELEGVFVLAELLRRYTFERADGGAAAGPRDYVVASTLPMRGGLPVRVMAR